MCRCVRTEELLRALELDGDGRCATSDGGQESSCQLMLNGIIPLASVMAMIMTMMMKMRM